MSDDGVEASSDVYARVAPVYIGVGLLSVLCTVVINAMYWLTPRLRHDHASTVINTVTTCDLLYTLKFLVSAIVWQAGARDERDSFHVVPDDCLSSVAYGQFFGMAAISWNACWIASTPSRRSLPPAIPASSRSSPRSMRSSRPW